MRMSSIPILPTSKICGFIQRVNVSLGFRALYCERPLRTPSGSCPLCLTPPCYHLEPPATAALFWSGVRDLDRRTVEFDGARLA
jgi:hypothetical protein